MLFLGLWAGMLKKCNQCPPIFLIANFSAKMRILKFGTKNASFGCFGQQFWKTIVILGINTLEFGTKNFKFAYLGAGIWKYYCHIWNRCPWVYLAAKFGQKKQKQKQKIPVNLKPKMSALGFFEPAAENDIAIFEISFVKFV